MDWQLPTYPSNHRNAHISDIYPTRSSQETGRSIQQVSTIHDQPPRVATMLTSLQQASRLSLPVRCTLRHPGLYQCRMAPLPVRQGLDFSVLIPDSTAWAGCSPPHLHPILADESQWPRKLQPANIKCDASHPLFSCQHYQIGQQPPKWHL